MKNVTFLSLQLALIFVVGFSKAKQEIKSLAKSPEKGYTGTFLNQYCTHCIVDEIKLYDSTYNYHSIEINCFQDAIAHRSRM